VADDLLATLTDLGGAGVDVVEVGAAEPAREPGRVRIGLHRSGPLPRTGLEPYDILLSAKPAAIFPWVGVGDLDAAADALRDAIERQPIAAAAAAQLLRVSLKLTFDQALTLESLAYSMLLASDGFRAWRGANPARERPDDGAPRVAVERDETIHIRLTRPGARNAFDARLRDELCEALAFALGEQGPVVLTGEGPAFSAGGDLDEFGRAADVGEAHLIRMMRSPARLAHALGSRLTARVHGACVGAGIEAPAAAGRLVAAPDATFRLPEVGMGLIPGAGGTVSIPRRIGRRRACWLAISGTTLDAQTALGWGLVDAVEPP
jgi:enoyl-CoA hydratase/carnithine racemase